MDYLQPENSLEIPRGSNVSYDLWVDTPATGEDDPLDGIYQLEGAQIILTVKRFVEDDEPLFFKSTNDQSIVITSPLEGKAEVFFERSDTSSLDPGCYWYDVWVRASDGRILQIIPPSPFFVTPTVTAFA